MTKKSLSEILRQQDQDVFARTWRETQAAKDYVPLPPGDYVARFIDGECFASKVNGTPA
jgi:hypothetical protein